MNVNTIPNSAAWFNSESQAAIKEELKDSQLIIRYLYRLKANNPGLVICYTRGDSFAFLDLHVLPDLANESLKFVIPVSPWTQRIL
jgi:hypothetical protein